jgi:hypothetical protein
MDILRRTAGWFRGERSSTRLGFLLQICCRVGYSLFSLIWTPLLLRSMGKALNGLFLSFQGMASLGGLGDLGMGGLVNIQTSRLLGQGKDADLRSFLAEVRAVFLAMAVLAAAVFLAISPYLFKPLKFADEPGVGLLSMLALIGAVAVGFLILNGYINNLNYGCGNIVWPIVPTFVVMQLGFCCHWLLARQHAPLWVQYIPYVIGAFLIHGMGWFFVKLSHPSLATVRPLHFNRRQFLDLGTKSFWVYLYSVATGIYITTDLFLITTRFGPQILPAYAYNRKLCELALFVIVSANLASLPKITQWLSSPEAATRERGIQESLRLNKYQTFLGCCAVLVYLNVNNWFIGLWLGKSFQVPLLWQAAFAANLAVTAGGLMGFDLVARCCDQGIRVGGITVFFAALLNLGLAFTAMKLGSIVGLNRSIFGIALATVMAQSAAQLFLGWYSSRQLKISWWHLSLKNWLLALAFVGFGLLTKIWVSPEGGPGIALLAAIDAVAFLIAARAVGISLEDLRQEKKILQSMFGQMRNP